MGVYNPCDRPGDWYDSQAYSLLGGEQYDEALLELDADGDRLDELGCLDPEGYSKAAQPFEDDMRLQELSDWAEEYEERAFDDQSLRSPSHPIKNGDIPFPELLEAVERLQTTYPKVDQAPS